MMNEIKDALKNTPIIDILMGVTWMVVFPLTITFWAVVLG